MTRCRIRQETDEGSCPGLQCLGATGRERHEKITITSLVVFCPGFTAFGGLSENHVRIGAEIPFEALKLRVPRSLEQWPATGEAPRPAPAGWLCLLGNSDSGEVPSRH